MRKLARSLILLYPANWRARYGEEFAALLEDSSPGWAGVFDLLKGAVKMQFNARSFPKLAGALAVAGMLAGLGISFLVTPRYVSTAAMEFTPAVLSSTPPEARGNLKEYFLQLESQILSRTSLARIMQDPRLDLYREARVRTPLEDVIEQMRRDVLIRLDAPGSTGERYLPFHITFAYSDRVKAQQTVQALITKFEDANLVTQRAEARLEQATESEQVFRLEMRIAALEKRLGIESDSHEAQNQLDPFFGRVNLDVLDPPSLPVAAIYPDRFRFISIGFGAGLATALLVAVFRRKPGPLPFPASMT